MESEKAKLVKFVLSAICCGFLIHGVVSLGCGPADITGRAGVDLFVIDSSTPMTKGQRKRIGEFGAVSHADAVESRLWMFGHDPAQVIDVGVKGSERVDREKYLDALAFVARHVVEHPYRNVVVNLSLGSHAGDAEEEELVEGLLKKGVVIVAAAGNDGIEKVAFPAAYPGVIAVGAVNKSRRDLARYSNRGPEIDILAPGSFEQKDERTVGSVTYVRTLNAGGTSFAAPQVTSIVVEMLELSNGREIDIGRTLRATATPLAGSEDFRRGYAGGGLLNEHAALTAVKPGIWTPGLAFILGFFLFAVANSNSVGSPAKLAAAVAATGILFGFGTLSAYLHSIRDRLAFGLNDAMFLDMTLLFVLPVITLALPVAFEQAQQRAHRWWWLRREVKRLVETGAFAELTNMLDHSDAQQRVQALGFLTRRGGEAARFLAEWLNGLAPPYRLAEAEVGLLNGFAKRHSSLGAELLKQLEAKPNLLDAGQVPSWFNRKSLDRILSDMALSDLVSLVAKMPPAEIRQAFSRCDPRLRESIWRSLVVDRIESLHEETLRETLERLAVQVVSSDHAHHPTWLLDERTMRKIVGTMSFPEKAFILHVAGVPVGRDAAQVPRELGASEVSDEELGVAVSCLSDFDLRCFCAELETNRLASALKPVATAAVIGRLGWGSRGEVEVTLSSLRLHDPLADYLSDVVTRRADHFGGVAGEPASLSDGRRRVILVLVVIVLACLFFGWLFSSATW